jgi:hypothetical protein
MKIIAKMCRGIFLGCGEKSSSLSNETTKVLETFAVFNYAKKSR